MLPASLLCLVWIKSNSMANVESWLLVRQKFSRCNNTRIKTVYVRIRAGAHFKQTKKYFKWMYLFVSINFQTIIKYLHLQRIHSLCVCWHRSLRRRRRSRNVKNEYLLFLPQLVCWLGRDIEEKICYCSIECKFRIRMRKYWININFSEKRQSSVEKCGILKCAEKDIFYDSFLE